MKKHVQACIIDDDAIAVFCLKRAMAIIGFTTDILIYENGLDALEDFAQRIKDGAEIPSLIFIDLNMPVMGGWDFMAEFNKVLPSKKNMPNIFIMTSSIDLRDMEKATAFGLESNYLIKPVSGDVLEGILA